MSDLCAHCEACHDDVPAEVKYSSKEAEQESTTEVICKRCGRLIAAFCGKILIEPKSTGVTII